jgi:C1A family cysteine protease
VYRVTVEEARNETFAFLQFQSFVSTFGRKYPSLYEYNNRYSIFKDNLKIAAELNTKDEHASYGVTKFMDLSRQEFSEFYLIKNFTSPKRRGESFPVLPKVEHDVELPASYDWNDKGMVTGVYNQGQCGSCWAFSTTENVESMWAIAGHSLQSLAMQQLVDCDTMSGGCGGGNPPNAYVYLIRTGGQESLSAYPYTAQDGPCQFNPQYVAAKIRTWGYVTTRDDENAMGQFTYQRGPPSVCVDAQYWQYYNGGVITRNCGYSMDHCVQITGWSTVEGIPAWNVRNSWGTDWGYNGYLYVMRGANVCLIGDEVTSSLA